ncbi:cytochrome ubiquinol oxidase subunit I [Calidifontimicrobium sp. SYSU G02091]|uniref:cytochrome ubiquinol oxidase subunit I n=1 Tax=Calidifontimicrobium sp. SYSU G02091 TaxID=2926421 RepID=UPI001F537328|nr:cytochrome ubiquinol oxidase subunit I [Calidifontimicrobium sp. SYSU G02091]MCI1191323.1 cytochrome ubiquinol oxidase subunit I [Calidifontimicrobium sp. SYSU G02091]
MDALILARMQFAANITFHILFPTITIALGWTLLFFRWRWIATRDDAWLGAYRFWTKVFALSFALGVVSGIVMSFQFGTNWPGFMERVGNIAGPLLGYEVLTAFFLEATFLGVMLFGHGRVSERVHLLATFLVALGTTLSAFWILSLNSWMHTPAGFEIRDGEFFVLSWLEVVFNPSFPYRLAHMLLASGLTVAFLLAGVSAWQVLKGKANVATPKVLRAGLTLGAVLIPVQILVGDLHGLNTFEHQPQKVAAMEGVWQTERGAPLLLFAWPDEAARENRFEIGIPKGASLILTHEPDGEIRGLDEFVGSHPPVAPVFFGFRIMVGTGLLMLAASWAGLWWYRRRGWVAERLPRPLLGALALMSFSGWVATVAGWYVTEIGRQPYMVYGLLRIDEVASRVPAPMIALTLALYVTVYLALVVAYVAVIRHMAAKPLDLPAPPAPKAVPAGSAA